MIIQCCMQKNPKARYPHIDHVLSALERVPNTNIQAEPPSIPAFDDLEPTERTPQDAVLPDPPLKRPVVSTPPARASLKRNSTQKPTSSRTQPSSSPAVKGPPSKYNFLLLFTVLGLLVALFALDFAGLLPSVNR